MKIISLILFICFSLIPLQTRAVGHLVLEPYNNSTTKEDGINVGIYLKEKIVGPMFFKHSTMLGMYRTEKLYSKATNYESRTEIGVSVFEWFDISAGYSLVKWQHQVEQENVTYMTLDAKLW